MTPYDEWKLANWDRAHLEQNISALTGTGFDAHLSILGCRNFFTSESRVLCIGVGTGQWVRDCAIRATKTWALDISPLASRSIGDDVTFCAYAEQLPTSSIDLALSNYVAPHMSDHDLECQLKEVIRSLTPNGILAMHYKEPFTVEQPVDNWAGEPKEAEIATMAAVLRRRSHLTEMVEWSGGQVIGVVAEFPCERLKINEVSIHIGKKAAAL